MHRSGTSALAGVLGLAGLAPPRTLLAPSVVNERGFWESEAVKTLNDEFFAELGMTWHGLEAIPFASLDDRRFRSAVLRAEATLIDEFAPGFCPLVKDPRLCRLLPFWKAAFAGLAARTVYAIILRNPLEVAQSLAERNEFEQDLACLLWARHYLDAEFHTRGLPRVLVTYDQLLEDWRGTLQAVRVGLDLENELGPANERNVDDFVAAGLKHHREADERVFADLVHAPLVQQTYRVLLDWASGGSISKQGAATLDKAREQFDLVSGTLTRVVENARLDRKRLTAARTQAEGTAEELARAQRAMEDLESLRESVEKHSTAQAGIEKRLETTRASLSEALQERSLLEQTLSEALKAARHERSALEQKLADTQRLAEKSRRALEQKHAAALEARDKRLEAAAASLSDARRDRSFVEKKLVETLKQAEQDHHSLELTIAEATSARDALSGELDKVRQDLRESVEKQSTAQAALETTMASLSEVQHERSLLDQKIAEVLKQAEEERRSLEQVIAETASAKDELTAELESLRRELRESAERQSAARAELEERFEATSASLSDALRERSLLEQELAKTLKQAEEERHSLELAVAQTASARDALSGELDKVRRDLCESVEKLSTAQAELKAAASARDALSGELERVRHDLGESVEKQSAAQAALEATAASLAEAQLERSLLEQELAEVLKRAEDERLSLELTIAQTASARDAVGVELDEARRDAERAAEENERERRELVDDFETKLRALDLLLSDTKSELKEVKRKYRSTQHQLSHDREKLRRTHDRLAEVEATLASVRETLIWRALAAVEATWHRTAALVRRAVGGRDRKARVAQLALLRRSPLFDRNWYLNRYPDVRGARIEPELHYLEDGWREGRDPSASFSTTSYLRLNPDVARSGVNPLLHYIEYGYSEGRHISVLPSPAPDSPAEPGEDFAPAAPCATFPLAIRPPVRWRRAARLTNTAGDLLSIADEPIGIVTSDSQRAALEGAFVRLAILSGAANKSARTGPATEASPTSRELLDAWYIGHARLRTRWRVGDTPLVVRAYQRSSAQNGRLTMVGEGLALSTLDFVDANLGNPYYPVLFVLSDPGGAICGCEPLIFPSLARGGLHYPELLALEHGGPAQTGEFDLVGQSERLADKLTAITDGTVAAAIGRLTVDLRGADSTEHLFQSDFRNWLKHVIGIGMNPIKSGSEDPAVKYVAGVARLPRGRRKTGGTLMVPSDTVPTISALVMPQRPGEGRASEANLALLIASIDHSEPATLIEAPSSTSPVLAMTAPDHRPTWPRIMLKADTGIPEDFPVAAIRRKRPMPAESELLVPVAQGALPLPESGQAITWLVFPDDWDGETFAQGLEALSLQSAASSPAVILVGETDPARVAIAQHHLGERVVLSSDLTRAIDEIDTPLVGYLGPQVILHDDRTSKILSILLEDPQVVSASCVLIATEARGKGWHAGVADAGTIASTSGRERSIAEQCRDAQLLWRSTYAVLRPPRDLWVSRTPSIKGWLQRAGPLRSEEGIQACTSLVTASYVGERNERRAHLRPPAAAKLSAIRTEALFG